MQQAGDIIYTPVQFRQKIKNKYLLVLEWDRKVCCLMINTGVHSMYGNELVRDCYVHLDQASHPFFTHDNSHVDCNEIHTFSKHILETDKSVNPDFNKGRISEAAKLQVLNALRRSPSLFPAQKDKYIPMLEGEDLPNENLP